MQITERSSRECRLNVVELFISASPFRHSLQVNSSLEKRNFRLNRKFWGLNAYLFLSLKFSLQKMDKKNCLCSFLSLNNKTEPGGLKKGINDFSNLHFQLNI